MVVSRCQTRVHDYYLFVTHLVRFIVRWHGSNIHILINFLSVSSASIFQYHQDSLTRSFGVGGGGRGESEFLNCILLENIYDCQLILLEICIGDTWWSQITEFNMLVLIQLINHSCKSNVATVHDT